MKQLTTTFLQSRRVRFFTALVAANVAIFVVFRICFFAYFLGEEADISTESIIKSLYIGTKFDVRLAILIVVPVFFLSIMPRIHLLKNKTTLWIAKFYLVLAMAFVFLTYFVDFAYYAYLRQRLNASILRFFEDAAISASMVWESYPVIWLFLGFLILVLIYQKIVVRFMNKLLEKPGLPVSRKQFVVGGIVYVFIMSFAMFGKISWYPLRWGDAFYNDQPFLNALGLNPTLFYFDTIKTRRIIYDEGRAKAEFPVIARHLGISPDNKELDFTRSFPGNKGNRPNIIYVILESFGANQYGLFGNPLNSTPYLDEIGKQGLVFDHFYVPTGGGTARSVFTAMTGIPDVYPDNTSSNNPEIVLQKIIMQEFKDYDKFYFIGGSASWRNIRALLDQNIEDLKLYEEGSYTEPRVDTWGISDLSLFREAVKVFQERQSSKPFIAVIQTSGNHRPFTIPEDNAGFKIIELPGEKKKWAGYRSQGRYNAVRFMDHSVGEFIKMMKKEPFFKNTVFAFHGDHGIYSSPSPHMPKYYDDLNLVNFNVPFILYSPEILTTPQRVSKPASEVDVFPTLAGISGIPYINTTLGRDLLTSNPGMEDFAFLGTSDMRALIGEKYMFRTSLSGEKLFLYDMYAANPDKNIAHEFPDIVKKMDSLSSAFMETSRYMLYFNKPANSKTPQ